MSTNAINGGCKPLFGKWPAGWFCQFASINEAAGPQAAQVFMTAMASRGRNNGIAERRQYGRSNAANTASSPGHQHLTLLWVQPRLFERIDGQHGGKPGGTNSHRLLQRQGGGQLDQPISFHTSAFSIATPMGLTNPPAGENHRLTSGEIGMI